jgi:hypothetical protein
MKVALFKASPIERLLILIKMVPIAEIKLHLQFAGMLYEIPL